MGLDEAPASALARAETPGPPTPSESQATPPNLAVFAAAATEATRPASSAVHGRGASASRRRLISPASAAASDWLAGSAVARSEIGRFARSAGAAIRWAGAIGSRHPGGALQPLS